MADTRQLIEGFFAALEGRDWAAFAEVSSGRGLRDPAKPGADTRARGLRSVNREFPGDWHHPYPCQAAPRLRQAAHNPTVVLVEGPDGVARFQWRVGDDLPEEAFVFFGVRDGLLASVTDFWPEPYDPPTGREHLTQRW